METAGMELAQLLGVLGTLVEDLVAVDFQIRFVETVVVGDCFETVGAGSGSHFHCSKG